jgi:hypothetical protein
MKEAWDTRIRRAEQLAARSDAARELLTFYGKLLRAQKEGYEYLRGRKGWLPSGTLAEDLPAVRATLPGLLHAVASSGPPALVEEARALARAGEGEIDEALLEQWRAPSDTRFFAKALLQPYACRLAESSDIRAGGGERGAGTALFGVSDRLAFPACRLRELRRGAAGETRVFSDAGVRAHPY